MLLGAPGRPPAAAVSRRAVTVLSGFLGSGKTTLLRGELGRAGAPGPAVILNDFGATMVDDALLLRSADAPIVISGGCACCTRREDLAKALAGLLDAEQRGAAPRHDQVVIETSGLSDPGPIAFTIANDPVLRHHYALARVCVTVDAMTGIGAAEQHEVALRQLLAADEVLITKADLVEPERVEVLLRWVHDLNPSARVAVTAQGDVLRTVPAAEVRAAGSGSRAPGDEGAHLRGISTLELTTREPLDWQAFSVWLSLLLHRHGPDVLRVKGVLDVRGTGPVALNAVQHVVHRPEHVAQPMPPGTRLVVIVRDLDPEQLERSFRAFLTIG
jgi:G3E family GTPase